MALMYRCWWCGDRTDVEPHRLEGATLDGVPMIAPRRLTPSEVDEVRLCWGCLERFAHFARVADCEYRDHLVVRSTERSITIELPASVAEIIRRIGGFDASAA